MHAPVSIPVYICVCYAALSSTYQLRSGRENEKIFDFSPVRLGRIGYRFGEITRDKASAKIKIVGDHYAACSSTFRVENRRSFQKYRCPIRWNLCLCFAQLIRRINFSQCVSCDSLRLTRANVSSLPDTRVWDEISDGLGSKSAPTPMNPP